MKRKELEGYLDQIEGFEKPIVRLEQYITSAEIAASMLLWVEDELESAVVGDLGCGTGMLSIGSAILGAGHVVGFDLDPAALSVAQANAKALEVEQLDLVHADVTEVPGLISTSKPFDVVIMNPPFGTKNNAGLDVRFLKSGLALARKSVFSLHKTSTRNFMEKVSRECGVGCEVIAELRYDLPKTMRFHKQTSKDIAVDFIRFDL